MSKKKKFLIAIIILISIPLAINTFIGFRQNKTAQAAIDKVMTARELAEEVADKELIEKSALLNKAGVVNQKIATSKIDACYVRDESNNGGWTTSNWFQGCYLRYVEGYTTTLSREEVLTKLISTNPEARNIFGYEQPVPDPPTRHCDLYVSKEFHKSVVYLPANLQPTLLSCEIPNLLKGTGGPEIVVGDQELSTKAFYTFDASQIDRTRNQIWIMFDRRYYHEDLGCGTIITCSNPRSHPSHPSI